MLRPRTSCLSVGWLTLALLQVAGTASAGPPQVAGACAPQWRATFGQDLNGAVNALATFDDGSGPALYLGGVFTQAAGLTVNRIARWDGTAFSALGSGVTGTVEALAVFDDGNGAALYVGGWFTQAGGLAAPYLARWDGANWSAFPQSPSARVLALEVHDDGAGPALFVGGIFQQIGGQTVNSIARWSGVAWSALGSGITDGGWNPLPTVEALRSFDDGGGAALYVGGDFYGVSGGVQATHIARWDGAQWSSVGGGVYHTNGDYAAVHTMVCHEDAGGPALWVGGHFDVTDYNLPTSLSAPGLARWSGQSWSVTGPGTGTVVESLAVFDDGGGPALYMGTGGIYRWDGVSWTVVGVFGGLGLRVFCMLPYEGLDGPALFAAGSFTNSPAGDRYLARYVACYPHLAYCLGDSGLCPCGNDGAADTGCANSTGAGATLDASGSGSVAFDHLLLHATGIRPNRTALAFCADIALNGGAGLPFGDGLRCAGGNLRRLGVRTTDAAGGATFGPGIAQQAGLSAGDTARFQVLYRDQVGSPCGARFNLTNGLEVVYY